MYTPSGPLRQITQFDQTGSSYPAYFSWCHREPVIAMPGDGRAPARRRAGVIDPHPKGTGGREHQQLRLWPAGLRRP